MKTKNIAVIQGNGRNYIDGRGICSIDFDGNLEKGVSAESVAEQFFDLNPHLRWSFRTGGNRGFNVWFRFIGKAPNGFILYTESGDKIGEFRATGNYTVVAGKHPDGPNYRTIIDLPAITITDFSTVKWIDGKPFSKKRTQDTHIDVYRNLSPLNGSLFQVEPLIEKYLPTAPHQTDNLHFDLAGEILGAGYSLNWSERLEIGRNWFDLADKKHLRPEIAREQYAKEFATRFSKRKFPKGGGSGQFDKAVERANQLDAPEIVAECFPQDPRVQFIGTLCRELARGSANNRFFLATRTIRNLLEAGGQNIGSRILKDLEAIGLIACVNRPPRGTRKAKEFIYLLNDFDVEALA